VLLLIPNSHLVEVVDNLALFRPVQFDAWSGDRNHPTGDQSSKHDISVTSEQAVVSSEQRSVHL
jgi:hypothetical protein